MTPVLHRNGAPVFLCAYVIGCSGSPPPAVELTELEAVPLADSIYLTGLVLGPGGDVIAWNDRDGYIVTLRRLQTWQTSVCMTNHMRPIAASATRTGQLTVVDGEGRVLVAVHALPACDLHPIARLEADSVLLAVFHGDTWVVGSVSAGTVSLTAVDLGAIPPDARRWPASIGFDDLGRSRGVSALEGIVLSMMDRPYSWVALELGGIRGLFPLRRSARHEGNVLAEKCSAAVGRSAEPSWVGLSTLEVGRIYLQTLADERSDWRCLATYSWSGRLQTVTVVNVALGLAAARRTAGGWQVVALRRTNRMEIVIYEVRFSRFRGVAGPGVR